MNTQDITTPSPDFREHLAWEITRAVRREARFGPIATPRSRRFATVALVIGCLAVGVAGNFASAQVRDNSRRDSIVAAINAEVELVRARLSAAQLLVESLKKPYDFGSITRETLARAEADVRALEMRLAQRQSALSETAASSLPPRDELSAPLVKGRDYVKERINLAMVEVQQALSDAEKTRAEVDRRVRAGVIARTELLSADLDLARLRSDLAVIVERLTLRQGFLEKKIPANELLPKLELTQRQEDLRVAELSLGLLQKQFKDLEVRRTAGVATDLDVARIRVQLLEREQEVNSLRAQLQKWRFGRNDSLP